jgi:hypothetical protein
MSKQSADDFINFEIKRSGFKTVIHSTEWIDGVLFMTTSQFDENNKLESKFAIRGDLVRGSKERIPNEVTDSRGRPL